MLDVLTEGRDRVDDGRREVGVATREARGRTGCEPEHVMEDEHLSDGVWPRTDADRRDGELLGDALREICSNRLEDDGEGTGLLDLDSVAQEASRRDLAPALNGMSRLMNRPWGEI